MFIQNLLDMFTPPDIRKLLGLMQKAWLCILVLTASISHGQTLKDLLEKAELNYPLLKSKQYERLAAENQVTSAKNAVLPNLDAAYQVNYATYNNITGMAATQYFVPISGPPSTGNSYDPVFGSVGSLLLSWDVFTFGQRSARTDIAKANLKVAEADASYEIFKHKINVTQNYLDLLFTYELLKVYQKNLERSQERAKEISVLTQTGLRPAVDSALFVAELSKSKIELLNIQKALESQQVVLAELIGDGTIIYTRDSTFFSKLPTVISDTISNNHPLISLSQARVSVNAEQRKFVHRTLYPKLSLWGTAYARGSGIRYDGYLNAEDGLDFTRYNYGVGLQLSVPILRFIDVRTQVSQSNNLLNAQQEKLNQASLQIKTQGVLSALGLKYAIESAREGPVFFNSAQFSYEALLTRYNSGLANYADLVQAQYGLLKAASDLKKSHLDAWKALLYSAAVEGDLNIFLNQVGN
jgi:outer membrane protein